MDDIARVKEIIEDWEDKHNIRLTQEDIDALKMLVFNAEYQAKKDKVGWNNFQMLLNAIDAAHTYIDSRLGEESFFGTWQDRAKALVGRLELL